MGDGMSRALDNIFGAAAAPDERRLPRVAEQPSSYQTSKAPDTTPDASDDQPTRG